MAARKKTKAAKAKPKKAVPKAKPKAASQTMAVYLCVRDAAKAIAFYKKAFGAVENYRLTEPSGRVGHADLTIGSTAFMLADEYPEMGVVSPAAMGGSPVKLYLNVDDTDAAVKKAVKAGAIVARPAQDEFYGHRSATVADPYGYSWMLSKEVEKVSPQEMQRRWRKMLKGG